MLIGYCSVCLFAYTNCGLSLTTLCSSCSSGSVPKVLMTKCHQLSDLESMEHVLSSHSGSQESGTKVSAGLVPFIWRGREYGTCFSSPFCWLPGRAWHSLACVILLLSLSLRLCIFSHHPLLPEFFLIETQPWLKNLSCTSG